jgi:AraC family transcriptional regulator
MDEVCEQNIFRSDDFAVPEFLPHRAVATPLLTYLETRQSTSMPASTMHYHDSFEFVVPHLPLTAALGSDSNYREIALARQQMLPINPGEAHGATAEPGQLKCHAFVVDRQLISEAADAMGATGEVEVLSDVVPVSREVDLLTRLFLEEARGRQSGYRFLLELTSAQIALYLLRACRSNIPQHIHVADRGKRDGIARVIEFFRENVVAPYSLTDVAGIADMNPYRFIRAFRIETGKTPQRYLTDLKIERACLYLRHTAMTITEICMACGFSDSSHFAMVFRRRIGVSPSEYRRQLS